MTSAAAQGWKAVPTRRLSLPTRWRNPIGIVGAVIAFAFTYWVRNGIAHFAQDGIRNGRTGHDDYCHFAPNA